MSDNIQAVQSFKKNLRIAASSGLCDIKTTANSLFNLAYSLAQCDQMVKYMSKIKLLFPVSV